MQSVSSGAPLLARAHHALDALLRFTSFYLIPLFIGLMSLVALAFWNSQYVATGDQALELQVVRQNAPALAHAELLSRLDGAAPLRQFDVGLQQAPVWFRFTSIGARDLPSVVELPSRHAVDIACWDALTMAPLGASTRSASSGALAPSQIRFRIATDAHAAWAVLCRALFA
ncbi:hypothetical protein LP420_36790 [Massilia sp. B-10]|nr:hypothetical protein LP420_36790 [Massilia sp. B-10]